MSSKSNKITVIAVWVLSATVGALPFAEAKSGGGKWSTVKKIVGAGAVVGSGAAVYYLGKKVGEAEATSQQGPATQTSVVTPIIVNKESDAEYRDRVAEEKRKAAAQEKKFREYERLRVIEEQAERRKKRAEQLSNWNYRKFPPMGGVNSDLWERSSKVLNTRGLVSLDGQLWDGQFCHPENAPSEIRRAFGNRVANLDKLIVALARMQSNKDARDLLGKYKPDTIWSILEYFASQPTIPGEYGPSVVETVADDFRTAIHRSSAEGALLKKVQTVLDRIKEFQTKLDEPSQTLRPIAETMEDLDYAVEVKALVECEGSLPIGNEEHVIPDFGQTADRKYVLGQYFWEASTFDHPAIGRLVSYSDGRARMVSREEYGPRACEWAQKQYNFVQNEAARLRKSQQYTPKAEFVHASIALKFNFYCFPKNTVKVTQWYETAKQKLIASAKERLARHHSHDIEGAFENAEHLQKNWDRTGVRYVIQETDFLRRCLNTEGEKAQKILSRVEKLVHLGSDFSTVRTQLVKKSALAN